MRSTIHILVGTMLLGFSNAAWSSSVLVEFSQTGFAGGGSVSGVFRGTDLDGNGQLYAMGGGGVDILGLPFGNELEFAEVTLDGFDTAGPITLTYDASVADMTDFSNFFMAFSYNLDGGSFGDEADEGWSFATFSPSINYVLGEAFGPGFWNPVPISNPIFGACGTGDICAGVLGFAPNPDAIDGSGVDLEYASFSRDLVSTTVVPLPGAVWLLLSGVGAISVLRKRRPQV